MQPVFLLGLFNLTLQQTFVMLWEQLKQRANLRTGRKILSCGGIVACGKKKEKIHDRGGIAQVGFVSAMETICPYQNPFCGSVHLPAVGGSL